MDVVFICGKFQEQKVDLNAFNQSLNINVLSHHGDAESNPGLWLLRLSSEM